MRSLNIKPEDKRITKNIEHQRIWHSTCKNDNPVGNKNIVKKIKVLLRWKYVLSVHYFNAATLSKLDQIVGGIFMQNLKSVRQFEH